MDLRAYYERIRAAEAALPAQDVVMVSLATPEGGKAGVVTETPRTIGARLIAEGRARVATDEEAIEFYEDIRTAKEQHEQNEAAKRIQVMVIPASSLPVRGEDRK